MPDAYKGLTIKLGGDASSLSTALRTVTRAATETQSKLKMMSRALKVDPSSSAAMTKSIKAINQQAEIAGSRLKKLQTAIGHLGKERITIFDSKTGERMTGTVAELAKKTQNVALTAEQARSAYNEVDAALERVYTSIRKNSKLDLRTSTDEEVERLARVGKITTEQANKVLGLRNAWHEADVALKGATKLKQFEHMSVEIDAVKSSIKGFSSQLIALDATSSVVKQNSHFAELDAKIMACDNALKSLQQHGQMLDEAIKFDPSNIGLVAQKIKNLKDQQDVAAQKAEALKEKLSSYPTSLIQQAANSQKNWALEVETTRGEYSRAQTELKSAEGALATLVEKQKQLKLLGDEHGAALMQAEIEKTREKVSSLGAEAQAAYQKFDTAKACSEIHQLTNEAQEATQESSKLGKAIKEIGSFKNLDFGKVQQLGRTLTAQLTVPIMSIAQWAKESARDVDAAFRDVRKTVQATPAQFEELRKAALDFSATHVTSPDQILEIEAMGGQLGVAADKLEKFAEVASNLDVATNLDSMEIATSMGQLSNILDDLNHDNLDQFGDALVRLGNNLPTQESDILEVTNRIASMGSIVGMSTPEVLAWSAAIASTGQKSESAGTAISKTMSQIETAVAGASEAFDLSEDAINAAIAEGGEALEQFAALAGMSAEEFIDAWSNNPQSVMDSLTKEVEGSTEKLEAFAKVAGTSAEDFAKLWKDKPSEALKLFVGGLRETKDSGGSVDKTLTDLGITSVRQKQALEGLVQTFGTLDGALTMSSDAWNGVSDKWGQAGDAAREADQKAEGFSGALAKLRNIGMAAGAILGDAVAPILSDLANVAAEGLEVFSSLDPHIQTTIVGLGGLAAAAGPALSTIGGLGKGILGFSRGAKIGALTVRDLATNSTSLEGALLSAMSATGGFENASASAASVVGSLKAGVIGLAVAGIAVLAADIVEAQAKQNAYKDALKSLDDTIDGMDVRFSATAQEVGNTGDKAQAAVPSIEQLTKDLVDLKEKTEQILEPAEDQNRQLEECKRIIDEYAGKEEISADKAGELQYAVDTLNAILGENYTVQDILNDKYEDAEGKTRSYREEIDKLIESKQREIQQRAYEDIYSETEKARVKKEQEVAAAQEQYDSEVDKTKKLYMNDKMGLGYKLDADAAEEMAKNTPAVQGYKDALDKVNAAYNETAKAAEKAKQKMNEVTFAQSEDGQKLIESIEGISGMSDALEKSGISIETLALKMDAAGISAETLKNVGVDNFNKLAKASGGDVDSIIKRLKTINDLGLDSKHFRVNDDGTIDILSDDLDQLNEKDLKDKSVDIFDNGATQKLKEKLRQLDYFKVRDKSFSITANTNTATYKLSLLQQKIDRMHGKTLEITTYNSVRNASPKNSPFPVATGGIRYHAQGMIFDRPTWLGDRDIVGEAGAEAIIPLTNKRYVSPFAGAVAEEFISKMNSMRSDSSAAELDSSLIGSQIAQSLDGAQVVLNGNVVGSLVMGASRKAAMNLG